LRNWKKRSNSGLKIGIRPAATQTSGMLDHPSSRVDLRSDTVTQPTKGMREAMSAAVVILPALFCEARRVV
jgi:hypothetical protein